MVNLNGYHLWVMPVLFFNWIVNSVVILLFFIVKKFRNYLDFVLN